MIYLYISELHFKHPIVYIVFVCDRSQFNGNAKGMQELFQIERDVIKGYSEVDFKLIFVDDEYKGLSSNESYAAWIAEIGL